VPPGTPDAVMAQTGTEKKKNPGSKSHISCMIWKWNRIGFLCVISRQSHMKPVYLQ